MGSPQSTWDVEKTRNQVGNALLPSDAPVGEVPALWDGYSPKSEHVL